MTATGIGLVLFERLCGLHRLTSHLARYHSTNVMRHGWFYAYQLISAPNAYKQLDPRHVIVATILPSYLHQRSAVFASRIYSSRMEA